MPPEIADAMNRYGLAMAHDVATETASPTFRSQILEMVMSGTLYSQNKMKQELRDRGDKPLIDLTGPLMDDIRGRCKDVVVAKLISPATARFPSDPRVLLACYNDRTDQTVAFATGDVDAQNRFGALLRGNYWLWLTAKGDARSPQSKSAWEPYEALVSGP